MANPSVLQVQSVGPNLISASKAPLITWSLCAVLGLNYLLRGGHDPQRAAELVLFLVATIALCRPGQLSLMSALGKRTGPLLAGFFVLGIVSSSLALVPAFAFYEVGSFFLLLLLGLAVGGELASSDGNRLVQVLELVGLGCLFYAFRVAVVYVSVFIVGIQPDILSFTQGFLNYRFFNHVQTVALPMLVLLTVVGPPSRRRMWCALSALWWALLFMTGGRGTMLGLATGAGVLLWLRGRLALDLLKALAQTALFGAAAYALLFVAVPMLAGMQPFGSTFSYLVERSVSDPTSARTDLWIRAFELTTQHPLLGVGPLHFAHYCDPRYAAHPHDWVLQIASEWGVPALLLLCAAVFCSVRALALAGRELEPGDRTEHAMLSCWLLTGLAILVDGLVSGVLVMPQSQLMIALYIGCASGWYWRHQGLPNGGTGWTRFAIPVLAWLALIAVIYAVAPDIGPRLRREPLDPKLEAINLDTAWPRLWALGHF